MKKVLMIVAMILTLCGVARAGEPNVPDSRAITLWVSGNDLAYQNSAISTWLGLRDKNIETGIATEWRMFSEGDNDEDLQSSLAVGPYGLLHFPDVIDVNMPGDISWLPKKLAGEPFVGISYLIDLDGKGTSISPVTGVRLMDLFALTYQYSFYQGVPVSDEGRIGLSFEWKF